MKSRSTSRPIASTLSTSKPPVVGSALGGGGATKLPGGPGTVVINGVGGMLCPGLGPRVVGMLCPKLGPKLPPKLCPGGAATMVAEGCNPIGAAVKLPGAFVDIVGEGCKKGGGAVKLPGTDRGSPGMTPNPAAGGTVISRSAGGGPVKRGLAPIMPARPGLPVIMPPGPVTTSGPPSSPPGVDMTLSAGGGIEERPKPPITIPPGKAGVVVIKPGVLVMPPGPPNPGSNGGSVAASASGEKSTPAIDGSPTG